MKILVSIFLLSLCTAGLSQSTGNDTSTEQPATNSTSSETTQTPTSTTILSTEKITTDASNTTEATTTTIAPPSPSPTPSPTPTPSPSPTPTPSPSPTPTPSPTSSPITSTTAPEPKPCTWNVTTEKGATCIQAELQAQFIIPIEGKDHKLLLGCDASTDKSDCTSNETQVLVLSDKEYELTLIFEKDAGKVFVRNVSLIYHLPEGEAKVANNTDNIFKVKAGNSYLCKTKFDVLLENVTMQVDTIHIQAFGVDKDFGTAEDCALDDKVSDIVPIAVGVALGALIIIVLIAYLVGRRRSRQKGYQSV